MTELTAIASSRLLVDTARRNRQSVRPLRHTETVRPATIRFLSMRSTLVGAIVIVAGLGIAVTGDVRGLVLTFLGVLLLAIGWAFFQSPTNT